MRGQQNVVHSIHSAGSLEKSSEQFEQSTPCSIRLVQFASNTATGGSLRIHEQEGPAVWLLHGIAEQYWLRMFSSL